MFGGVAGGAGGVGGGGVTETEISGGGPLGAERSVTL